MDASILLARIIGPLFFLIGIGSFMNPRHYGQMTANFLKDSPLYYFSGAIALVIGIAIVLFHNIWVSDWRVLITVIGWASVFKGSIRILFPAIGITFADYFSHSTNFIKYSGIFVCAVGAWLSFAGYF